ncbi:hypothetical protein H5410_023745 [Solanum commersonii]|uniref:Uncharacterized protein n=1 Tax=Solanum commersonii TaxID=4109 RepID=A0A9J5ZJP9_SOLCO|nr:hypothetical protein H5410_023745 [Solanum commersonii]
MSFVGIATKLRLFTQAVALEGLRSSRLGSMLQKLERLRSTSPVFFARTSSIFESVKTSPVPHNNLPLAANNGVPFILVWGSDVAEDMGGVREVSGGRDGAEIQEFGAASVELKIACDNKMGLELFEFGETSAF